MLSAIKSPKTETQGTGEKAKQSAMAYRDFSSLLPADSQ